MKTLLLALSSLLLLTGCDKCGKRGSRTLIITNNSSQRVRIFLATHREAHPYPDTTINETSKVMRPVDPTYSGYFYDMNSWDEDMSLLPADTISIYIFSQDTIDAYPWEEIRQQYNILVRYDLSLSDLKRLDFRLSYPADDKMQGVRTYP